jgi:GNAT superfamily N-acetyltransferase
MAGTVVPKGYRLSKFDFARHAEFVIGAQILSVQVAHPDFKSNAHFEGEHRDMLRATAEGKRNDRVLVLETDKGEPAGVSWIEVRPYPTDFDGEHKPEPWPELTGKVGAQFRNTYIVEAHRGHGLARCIKQAAEDAAREAGAVFLYTRCGKNNSPMLTLNAAMGYEAMAEEGHYMRLRKKLAAGAW